MKNKLEIKRLIRWTRKPEVVVLVAGSLVAGWYLVNNLQDADPGLRAGIIGALGAVVAAIVTHVNTKRREINERHFSEKREAYGKIIELIFDLIMKTKSGKQISGKEAHLVKKNVGHQAGSNGVGQSWCHTRVEQFRDPVGFRHTRRKRCDRRHGAYTGGRSGRIWGTTIAIWSLASCSVW